MTRLGRHGLDHVFHTVRNDFLEAARSWTDSTAPDDAGVAAVVELVDPTGERAGRVYTAVGEPERVTAVLRTVTPDDTVRGVLVTRGTGALAGEILSGWGLGPAATWDRMATETAPKVPDVGGAVVERLDLDRDIDEMADVLAEANPNSRLGVRDPRARRARWYGVRLPSDGAGRRKGALVAVGSATPVPGDAVHLGAIGTLPEFRGRGYAGAMTARMTADGVAERGLVTLGLYDDNVAARRVYDRLGFVLEHEVEQWHRV
ncbi:GNAT family N-acetyltransferase [Promicromonospora iranensis]|uniref:Ribosomal protein S18 acetylase RimI-like enzyme n=1 Tax=Promicromonospora iranensis TaxID=1105144 RepID=A0ABU2CVL8_9MICO|nr:GNAT family N-acetyltransferase [Promicromonospora iranensis]MDR7385395.1 ribosomal protein S18 acetylase RimI-like enzyme [Promicromonospora iranensis]